MKYLIWLLIVLDLYLSTQGFKGGVGFLQDPSGAAMHIPLDLIEGLPLKDFLIPGIFLTFVYGVGGVVVAVANALYKSWAAKANLVLGIILVGWIVGEMIVFPSIHTIQYIFLGVGVTMTVASYLLSRRTQVR